MYKDIHPCMIHHYKAWRTQQLVNWWYKTLVHMNTEIKNKHFGNDQGVLSSGLDSVFCCVSLSQHMRRNFYNAKGPSESGKLFIQNSTETWSWKSHQKAIKTNFLLTNGNHFIYPEVFSYLGRSFEVIVGGDKSSSQQLKTEIQRAPHK